MYRRRGYATPSTRRAYAYVVRSCAPVFATFGCIAESQRVNSLSEVPRLITVITRVLTVVTRRVIDASRVILVIPLVRPPVYGYTAVRATGTAVPNEERGSTAAANPRVRPRYRARQSARVIANAHTENASRAPTHSCRNAVGQSRRGRAGRTQSRDRKFARWTASRVRSLGCYNSLTNPRCGIIVALNSNGTKST